MVAVKAMLPEAVTYHVNICRFQDRTGSTQRGGGSSGIVKDVKDNWAHTARQCGIASPISRHDSPTLPARLMVNASPLMPFEFCFASFRQLAAPRVQLVPGPSISRVGVFKSSKCRMDPNEGLWTLPTDDV
jgi:hypothetical protein